MSGVFESIFSLPKALELTGTGLDTSLLTAAQA